MTHQTGSTTISVYNICEDLFLKNFKYIFLNSLNRNVWPLFYLLFSFYRFSLAHELHPDWMLMLFFMHTHLTVTVTLGLLLIPKVINLASVIRSIMPVRRWHHVFGWPNGVSSALTFLVPVWGDAPDRRHCHRGLRGRVGHGSLGVLPQQQHHVCMEWAQPRPRGHTG